MLRKISEYHKTISKKLKGLYKNGFFHVMIGNSLVKMITFVSSIVVVRLISKQEYAYLAYANNLYSYISLFSGLGLSTALLKYNSSTNSGGESKAYLMFAIKYGLIFQTLLTAAMLLYVVNFDIPFPEAKNIIYLLVLLPLLTYSFEVMQSYVRSKKNNRLYAKVGIVKAFLVLVLSIFFAQLIGVNGIPIARYIATLLPMLLMFIFIRQDLEGANRIKLDSSQVKKFVNLGVSLMIANLFSMIMPLNEMTLVNNIIRDEIITANYKVAMLFPSQLGFITGSIMIYYFPIISRMKDNKTILITAKKIQLVAGIIIGIICIAGFILTPLIIKLLYGQSYSDAKMLSRLFWIIYGINAGFRMIPMNILPALGRAKFNAILAIISSAVHFILDYVFISMYGISGVALATSMIYVISGMIYWIYLIKLCNNKDESANYE